MPMSRLKARTRGGDGGGRNSRTRRACDRCRLKKAKCDGNPKCETCHTSDSACTYSIRRKIEARTYYSRMQGVTDIALQQLYWACRQKSGFPGKLPDESTGAVTTDAILEGLGLLRPLLGGRQSLFTTEGQPYDKDIPDSDKSCDHLRISFAEGDSAQSSPITVSSSSFDAPPSTYRGTPACGSSGQSVFACKENFNMETNTSLPSVVTAAQAPIHDPVTQHDAAQIVDRNDSQDTDSYTVAPGFKPADLAPEMKGRDSCQVKQLERRAFDNCVALEGIMFDSYLAPWPGSLAAAFQSVHSA
ncbi:uncharacterized protein PV06_11210 [Exophiala oligosperma]|uniref:Zn(2)-C6 fungal-type domain-containing protein n=1 Tax=Exophiala oligosperma TaxID=215243 RepID=A0A0D2D2V6_9EURO|nr:uncharacterized protein PV06_11210 [Exophiala oligosperma]KIW36560.1 hypothetical protein PV06_11210 [Exophiala oligosperma]